MGSSVCLPLELDSLSTSSLVYLYDHIAQRTNALPDAFCRHQGKLSVHLKSWQPGSYTLIITTGEGEPDTLLSMNLALVPYRSDRSEGKIRLGLGMFWPHEWPQLGIKYYRCNWTWRALASQSDAGQFGWTGNVVGRYRNISRKNDLVPLAVLWAPPPAEAGDPALYPRSRDWSEETYKRMSFTLPPKSMAHWRNYVGFLLAGTSDLPMELEVWNEPDSKGFYNGTLAAYAQLIHETRFVVDSLQTGTTLVGGVSNTTGNFALFDSLYSYGALENLDVVSVHAYGHRRINDEFGIYRNLQTLQSRLASYGFDGPIWITELGGYSAPRLHEERPLSQAELDSLIAAPDGTIFADLPLEAYRGPYLPQTEARTAAYFVRVSALILAAGVERIYFHHWWSTQGRKASVHALWDFRLNIPQLHTIAIVNLNYWLSGSELVEASVDSELVDITFSRGNDLVRIVWSYNGSGTLSSEKLGGKWQIYDIYGRSTTLPAPSDGNVIKLTEVPIYLVAGKAQRLH